MRLRGITKELSNSKFVKYSKVSCSFLSECVSKLEKVTGGAKRLQDPDEYMLIAGAEDIYRTNRFMTVLELTDGMSRVFYLIPGDFQVPGEFREEFELYFRVRREGALGVLLRTILTRNIRGRRFRHRSALSFLVGFGVSFATSSLVEGLGLWIQSMVAVILTVLIYVILDYPFSLLYLRGVELTQKPKRKAVIMVIKQKGKGETS